MNLAEIKQWLALHDVKNYTIRQDVVPPTPINPWGFAVDVSGSVYINKHIRTTIPIQFGIVSDNFD
jgi:hypothetical protein